MKKLFGLLITIISIVLIGCATTSNVAPSEIEYKEIAGNLYFNSRDADLYSSTKGYKISEVFILGADTRNENGTKETLFLLTTKGRNNNVSYVYATDFIKNIKETDSTWIDRFDSVRNEKKYNGHYTVYVYGRNEGNFLDGYTTKVTIYNIEGVPSQEQIEADKEAAEAERIAKEEAEKKAEAEKYAKLNAAGKSISKGYIYHGEEEVKKNCKLFANGALESGHAYYISGFVVKYGGSMAKIVGFLLPSQSYAVYVDYISQKVKGEVVEAGIDLFGEKPITVVVAGGKGVTKIPVVLGIIEEK
jgi:hypothetical protein